MTLETLAVPAPDTLANSRPPQKSPPLAVNTIGAAGVPTALSADGVAPPIVRLPAGSKATVSPAATVNTAPESTTTGCVTRQRNARSGNVCVTGTVPPCSSSVSVTLAASVFAGTLGSTSATMSSA